MYFAILLWDLLYSSVLYILLQINVYIFCLRLLLIGDHVLHHTEFRDGQELDES